MILRRSPDGLTLASYDGYVSVSLGIPVPWRVLWHEGPANWTPGTHLDDASMEGWVYLADRVAVREAREELDKAQRSLAAENLRLKKELKRAGKAYGRASQTIGWLRSELTLARLHRRCMSPECPGRYTAYADDRWRATVRHLPRSLGMGRSAPADTPVIGSQLEPVTEE